MNEAATTTATGLGRAGWDRDGVRVALISNRIESIARKMQNTLFRTARSGVLNTAHDFSCVILTADCRLLGSAESLPIHTLIGPDLMCEAVRRHHPVLRAGDCFLHNSPYEGNSHPADHCLIVPVVDAGGTLRFFVLAKAHQADCGNSRPTTYMGHAVDVYEEGALIFSATQVQRDYQDNQDIIRMCRARIRVPEQWWGDYLATLGAVRIGERELLALGQELGWDTLERYTDAWFDYCERKMVEAIRRLPSGRATVHSAHDPFPGVPDGIPVKLDVAIDAENAMITVDLRDNVDCQPCGLNLSEGCARTAAMVGIYNGIIDHTVPANAGSFRRIDIRLRENCAVGIPRHPHSCSVATTNLADRVANPVQRAMAEIAPGFGMAETGPIQPPGMAVISGRDPRNGEAFVNQVFLGVTGGAGTPLTDGFLSIIHVGNAGLCRIDSIEVDELHHPIFVGERRLLPDSEGPGEFRGAPSALVEFGPIEGCTMQVLYTADGTINPALGARGGGPGSRARALKRELDGSLTTLPACHGVTLAPGEHVISHSAGGGGYGSPTERDPERVRLDVLEGWISPTRARTVYGVALEEEGGTMVIDHAATAALRAAAAGAVRVSAPPAAVDWSLGAAYVDGRFMPLAEARIPVTEWGYRRSDVTYDVVGVYFGAFFRLDDHLRRFRASMHHLRLEPAESDAEIKDILMELVRRTGLREAYVAMDCLRSRPPRGVPMQPVNARAYLVCFAMPWVWLFSEEQQARGVHAMLAKTPRIPAESVDPTVKNFHWGDLTAALFEASDAGFDTAVLLDARGNVTEGPGFNVFAVVDGTVVSPPEGALEGITRLSVFELCRDLGIPCEIRPLSAGEFAEADEIFFSTTAGGIMPVSRLGRRILGNDRPGPVSARLRETFWERRRQGWHATPVDYAPQPVAVA